MKINLGLISLATNFLIVWLKWPMNTFSKLSCPNSGSWSICACRSGTERGWSRSCSWCTGGKFLLWVRDFMLFTYFPDLSVKHCHDPRTKTVWNVGPSLDWKNTLAGWYGHRQNPFPLHTKCRFVNTYSYTFVGLASRCLKRLIGDRC